jgi:hypothetical protein
VDVEVECVAAAPVLHVTNLGDQSIIFHWSGPLGQVIIAGGEEFQTEWPFAPNSDQLAGEVTWTAYDLNDVEFDSGGIRLIDVQVVLPACSQDFNADIDWAQMLCPSGALDVGVNASAPVGYDKAQFSVQVRDDLAGQSKTFETSLPMSSDREFFWSDAHLLPGVSYVLTGNGGAVQVTFIDVDGSLPRTASPSIRWR